MQKNNFIDYTSPLHILYHIRKINSVPINLALGRPQFGSLPHLICQLYNMLGLVIFSVVRMPIYQEE